MVMPDVTEFVVETSHFILSVLTKNDPCGLFRPSTQIQKNSSFFSVLSSHSAMVPRAVRSQRTYEVYIKNPSF